MYYGIENSQHSNRGIIGLFAIYGLQGYLIFRFLTDFLKKKREIQAESGKKKSAALKNAKKEKKAKIESDLPEADQNPKKLKAK